jgi:predicted DsbA family dithiol-disulfide isomerase
MTQPAQIKIDIVSDVVCPWCIVGYEQLRRAIGAMEGKADISVRWHPFELAPYMPQEGQPLADYARERYGATPDQSRANRARLKEVGDTLGIDFRWDEHSRIYNSHKAHELLAWAGEQGKQTKLKLELFKAYFTDQSNISDDDVLLDAAERAGLDSDEAKQVLASRQFASAVDASVEYWRDQNVTGVPAYVVNGKYMIPGAQDADTFVQIFDRVIEREAAAA